jgi:5-oxoprolinase (ATP-hydrolysing)
VVREIEFLAPLEFSILSQHRDSAPFGMAGGGDGATGRQTLIDGEGRRRRVGGVDGFRVAIGDRLVLETPGGGGYGEPDE